MATGAYAQTNLDPNWARQQEVRSLSAAHNSARTAQLNRQHETVAGTLNNQHFSSNGAVVGQPSAFVVQPASRFGPAVEFATPAPAGFATPPTAASSEGFGGLSISRLSDVWIEGPGHTDRLRLTTRGALRRADGSPTPPRLLDGDDFDVSSYDVSYTRGWDVARGYTASGREVTLTPHAGLGMGDDGTSAEVGATLRIGERLDGLMSNGRERFGDRARWYLYAAGSRRAVGYNFARTRDGDYSRSGVTQDKGAYMGDASIGVAYRRGSMQGSLGVVYREIKAEGLRGGEGLDRDVSEGLVAFQLSIRPEW